MAHYVRELLADAVVRGFAGAAVLAGTGAVTVRTDLPVDSRSGPLARNIVVPYFGNIGELEDIPLTGAALTPVTIASDGEVAAVNRSGKAFFTEIFDRLSAAEDPYEIMQQQAREALRRRADKAMIDIGSVPAAGNVNLTDVWSAVTPKYYDLQTDINAQLKWSDEVDVNGGAVARVVHPVVWGDISKLTDAMGRPLVVDTVEGGMPVRKFNGVPTLVTARMPVDTSNPSFPKYTSLLLKRNAGVFWSSTPYFDTDKDILSAADLAATHVFWAAHFYRTGPGGTTPGWQVVKTNGGRPDA